MTAETFKRECLPLGGAMYALAMQLLRHADEAKEAVQETFTRLWERRETLGNIDNLQAYSLAIVRNVCILRIRQAARWEDIDETQTDFADTDDDGERIALEEKAQALLAEQPPEVREIFRLRFVEGLTTDAIATKTGKTPDNVRTILSRRLRQMREQLKNEMQ